MVVKSVELYDLYRQIGLQTDVIETLRRVSRELDWSQAAPYLEQLLERTSAPSAYQRLNAFLSDDPGHFKLLCCYLECARRAYKGYQDRHIPDMVYIDTMKCFPRFLGECEREHGRMYFDRGWWAYRQTSMSLFRVGALEYEFSSYEGEPALALHIPSDALLSAEMVDRSLEQAKQFFQTCFPEYQYGKFICDSWLLVPQLKPLLPQNSNIRAFQERFQIIRQTSKDLEFIECLYQVPRDTDVARLPEATSLQRNVKTLLLNGGSVGRAYGIMI